MTATANLVSRWPNALAIPRLTHAESGRLASAELERVLVVVDALTEEDWRQPTDCTAWTVREMVAHLAGSCAAFASRAEFVRQMVRNPYLRTEKVLVDGINRRQVEDRAGKSTTALVAELREVGPKAIWNRQRTPWVVRQVPIPLGPPKGFGSLGYLLDTLYPRDEWMHRADLCRATGRPLAIAPAHDGRISALVLRDLAQNHQRNGDRATVDLVLTGPLGDAYRYGQGVQPDATLVLDGLQFHRLASGRITPAQAREIATIEGDETVAHRFLENCAIIY